jgi:membrane-associated phospholipid phosphatase
MFESKDQRASRVFLRIVAAGVFAAFSAEVAAAQAKVGGIEEKAGEWKTWILNSAAEIQPAPAPTDPGAIQNELEWLRAVIPVARQEMKDRIAYWDAGSPTYRWVQLMMDREVKGRSLGPNSIRTYAYVTAAMYDATVAVWRAKYAYNRPRPSQVDPTLPVSVSVPASPSYPSEHAAIAAAAAEVLAYAVPAEAEAFRSLAEEAGLSRLFAGVQYPTDYFAGREIGRQVAARVIERAKGDNFDFINPGPIPQGAGYWVGTNPGNVNAVNWKTFVLSSASEFRPPPPPAWNSPETAAALAEVKGYPRTFLSNGRAYFWQLAEGRSTWFYEYLNRQLAETKQELNPPRAARAYALLSVCMYDAFTASQDGKFHYWYARPRMLDPTITELFAAPNFPSYPSNHSTFSTSRGEVLAYLFPQDAEYIRGYAAEAGNSRIWAGIHYQFDNQAGNELGRKIANKCIAWAESDGSRQ